MEVEDPACISSLSSSIISLSVGGAGRVEEGEEEKGGGAGRVEEGSSLKGGGGARGRYVVSLLKGPGGAVPAVPPVGPAGAAVVDVAEWPHCPARRISSL